MNESMEREMMSSNDCENQLGMVTRFFTDATFFISTMASDAAVAIYDASVAPSETKQKWVVSLVTQLIKLHFLRI